MPWIHTDSFNFHHSTKSTKIALCSPCVIQARTHTHFVIVHFIHRPWNLMQNLCFYDSIEREKMTKHGREREKKKRSQNMERNENFLCANPEQKIIDVFFSATHSSLSITVVCKLKILYWVVNTSSLHQITLIVICVRTWYHNAIHSRTHCRSMCVSMHFIFL